MRTEFYCSITAIACMHAVWVPLIDMIQMWEEGKEMKF